MCTTYNALRNSMVFDFTFHEPTSTRRTGKWRTVEETNPHARISDFCREPLSIFEVSASYVNQIPDIQCQIIVRLFVDSPWLEVGAWRHSLHRWDTHTMGMLIKSEVTTSAASTRDISQKRLCKCQCDQKLHPADDRTEACINTTSILVNVHRSHKWPPSVLYAE